MPNISTSGNTATLISVFTVEPARQQPLVDALARATDEIVKYLPGFISASIHKSIDGVRVTSYAQWRSQEDLEAMLNSPAAMPHLNEAAALATSFDPHVYEVTDVRTVARGPSPAASGAAAIGALAIGACAVGAVAIGRLAIGALALRRGHVRKLSIDDVAIGRLSIRELDTGSPAAG